MSAIAVAAGTPVQAAPVTYTLTGFGSGSLNGQSFTNASFTIASTADTAQVTSPLPSIFAVANARATVSLPGLGASAALTIPTITVDNQVLGLAGLSAPGENRAVLLVGDRAFATYDLTASIGPVSGSAVFNPGLAFATTAGAFTLTAVSGASFGASVVPEPSPLALFAIGAVGLAGCAQRRASQTARDVRGSGCGFSQRLAS